MVAEGGTEPSRFLEVLVLKKVLAVATLAEALAGIADSPALAAGSACLTTTVTVNGTPAPTNGTNCVDLP